MLKLAPFGTGAHFLRYLQSRPLVLVEKWAMHGEPLGAAYTDTG